MGSELQAPQGDREEAAYYSILALTVLGVVFVAGYWSPVFYVRLIAEDQLGEYGSAVAFGLAGVTLLVVAKSARVTSARILWALAGVVLLFIAAEEISWGQRIARRLFGFTFAPESVVEINTQGEFNFHNIGAFDALNRSWLHYIIGVLVIVWASVSAWFAWSRPAWWVRLEQTGVPVIKLYLVPLFLAVSYIFLAKPLPHSGELGESLLALATLTWAIDLYVRMRRAVPTTGMRRLACVSGAYVVVLFMTAALVSIVPGGLGKRLNVLAASSYPALGMYEQAEEIFVFIREEPRYERPETRLNHARLLFELGRVSEGRAILEEAIPLQTSSARSDGSDEVARLRRRGAMHELLGEGALARRDFEASLKIDTARLDASAAAEEQALIHWSRAKTLREAGDFAAALDAAKLAQDSAVSAKLAGDLARWISDLDGEVRAQ